MFSLGLQRRKRLRTSPFQCPLPYCQLPFVSLKGCNRCWSPCSSPSPDSCGDKQSARVRSVFECLILSLISCHRVRILTGGLSQHPLDSCFDTTDSTNDSDQEKMAKLGDRWKWDRDRAWAFLVDFSPLSDKRDIFRLMSAYVGRNEASVDLVPSVRQTRNITYREC